MTADEPGTTAQPQTIEPTIAGRVVRTTSRLKPLIKGSRHRRVRGGAKWPPQSPYLTDGRFLYRVVSHLGAPVSAVVLEDCLSSAELLCTRFDVRSMRLREVS